MKYFLYFVIVILLFSPPLSAQADQYLCKTERAAGFQYVEGSNSWESTIFNSESKYVISQAEDIIDAYKITRVGDNNQICSSEKGFDEYGNLPFDCIFGMGQAKFNKNNGRFIFSWVKGYVDILPGMNKIADKNSSTPLLEIGKCSQF